MTTNEQPQPEPVSLSMTPDLEMVMAPALEELCKEQVVDRIWSHDHTVWKSEPTEIDNRLGWLRVWEAMAENVDGLQTFVTSVLDDGIHDIVLIGMGGSSLAPELFHKTFGRPTTASPQAFHHLNLTIMDSTDPQAINRITDPIDWPSTLFIVATKSGGTVETLSGFKHFYNLALQELGSERAGQHFVAITDPGSKLEVLARKHGFREVFLNDPDIGGRFSALSYFGLVPAALVGVDIQLLLERTRMAAENGALSHCDDINDNIAAQIGAVLGTAVLAGQDKLTFITSPGLESFGDWVEQLIAESTGKEGQGILPVVDEPAADPESYGKDRLFVDLRMAGDTTNDARVTALAAAGHPVITLNLNNRYDVGGQFLVWELATAIAGYFLQINPFDQPNVESAKQAARQMVVAYQESGILPAGEIQSPSAEALDAFLETGQPGDYITLQAFVPSTPETDQALNELRQAIGERYGLATTAGYGPRFLHSTGQLHKGDGGNGLFIQLVSLTSEDLPIPDEAGSSQSTMTFGVLKKAQALGDAQALRDAGRRVIVFQLEGNVAAGIRDLA